MVVPISFELDTLLELLLAISLSAAAGFRVFVPLLVLSAAAVLGHIELPPHFDWIENPQALSLFGIAAIFEVVGYSIPWFDHLLDIFATPAAMIAGTIVAAGVAPEMDPLVQWTLAIVAGGGAAGLTKTLMNLLRGGSTAATGGLANPIFAAIELALAIGLSVVAITAPLIAGGFVISIFGLAFFKLSQLVNRWRHKPEPSES